MIRLVLGFLIGWLVLAVGCSGTAPRPEVTSVMPNRVNNDVEVRLAVIGRNFFADIEGNLASPENAKVNARFELRLTAGDRSLALKDVRLESAEKLGATLEAGAPVGTYGLDLLDPRGRAASLAAALVVVASDCTEDRDGDGHTAAVCGGDDCDDDPAACGALCFPGNAAADVCDGYDQDCDGSTDEDPERVWYPDMDGDGYTNTAGTRLACSDPDGAETGWVATLTTSDCDDDPAACGALCFPDNAAADVCDGYDQDCDGSTDEDPERVWYPDTDGDGYTNNAGTRLACSDPDGAETGWVATPTTSDCDDNPLACGALCSPDSSFPDVCDAYDQDCDGLTDEDPDSVWYHDADGDGYTNNADTRLSCSDPDGAGVGWTGIATTNDCDDNPATCGAGCFPGNPDPDFCDGYDQDCNGAVDDDRDTIWYHDADGDGYTNNADTQIGCLDPDGDGTAWSMLPTADDCNDADSNVWDACATCKDDDADGFFQFCNAYDGIKGPDCDDDPAACGALCFPGNPAPDLCDGFDQDCDSLLDEDAALTWYHDADGDGFTANADKRLSCVDPDGAGMAWVLVPTDNDCDDDPAACGALCFPGNAAPDVCDGYDQDCDGLTDEGPDIVWYHDADGDGYTNDADTRLSCSDPDGVGAEWVAIATANDCDDNPATCGADCFPGNPSPDFCDGFDQECDGSVDEDQFTIWYHDADGDRRTNNADTQVGCFDPDGDASAWIAVATANDCDDADLNAWDTCATCRDRDGDGYHQLCNTYRGIRGPDCDDDPAACGAACFPGNPATDTCDGYNQDCDAEVDEDAELTWYHDNDRDGFTKNADIQRACVDPDGGGKQWVATPTANDCDDDPAACGAACFPGNPAPDICDGYNQDCDGEIDENSERVWYHDADRDGYTNNADVRTVCVDPDGAGSMWVGTATANDCNDANTNAWSTCTTCIDGDGDGYFWLCNRYFGINGPDCDDNLSRCTVDCTTDTDRDGVPDCGDLCNGGSTVCDGLACEKGCCQQICGASCASSCNGCDCYLDCAGSTGGCSMTCEQTATCSTDCSNSVDCRQDCVHTSTCDMDCSGSTRTCETYCSENTNCQANCSLATGACVGSCVDGADCVFNCNGAKSCSFSCNDSGSNCSVDCTNGTACDVVCTLGARCILYCAGSASCNFQECDGGVTNCPGNIKTCNQTCP